MQFTKANAIFSGGCLYNMIVVVVSSGHNLRVFLGEEGFCVLDPN